MALLLQPLHHLVQNKELARSLDQLLPLVIARGSEGGILQYRGEGGGSIQGTAWATTGVHGMQWGTDKDDYNTSSSPS